MCRDTCSDLTGARNARHGIENNSELVVLTTGGPGYAVGVLVVGGRFFAIT